MTYRQLMAIMAFLFWAPPSLAGNLGVAGSTGVGVRGITPYRAAALWDLGPIAWQHETWIWRWLWEASGAYWESDGDPTYPNSPHYMTVWSTGPQLRLMRAQAYANTIQPYWELGIGATWISKKEMSGRQLGIHYQFEDRLGFGARFGQAQQYDVNARVIHYSNASISTKNSGVNIGLLTVGFWF